MKSTPKYQFITCFLFYYHFFFFFHSFFAFFHGIIKKKIAIYCFTKWPTVLSQCASILPPMSTLGTSHNCGQTLLALPQTYKSLSNRKVLSISSAKNPMVDVSCTLFFWKMANCYFTREMPTRPKTNSSDVSTAHNIIGTRGGRQINVWVKIPVG